MGSTTPLNSAGRSDVLATLRESILTGIAIVIPALVTVYVLELAIRFLLSGIAPWVRVALALWPGVVPSPTLVDGLGLGVLGVVTVALGFSVHFHTGEAAVAAVDSAITRVPGVGTLYGSVRRMTDSMLVEDDRGFQAVKLVEVPAVGHYMLGFVITESPTEVQDAFEEEVQTLFVPLAPNPVMAGFVVHAREAQIRDVDMSVEEGMSAIVSLGATEGADDGAATSSFRGERDVR